MRASKAVTVAGDVWYVGNGPYGAGIGNYGIATSNTGLTLTISSAGVVNIPGSLTVAGHNVLPFAGGRVSASGSQVSSIPAAQSTWTSANGATGTYTITLGTAYTGGAIYTPLAAINSNASGATYVQTVPVTSTSLSVYTYVGSSLSNLAFSFLVL